jgi:hypothetical protein
MFENAEVLDASRHGDLRFKPVAGFAFARTVASAPLAPAEVVRASREYPIVFRVVDGTVSPVALLSLHAGASAFVDDEGSWTAGYVPAHIRRYPFVLGSTREAGRFVVMVDRDAPQLGDEGEPLFEAGKAPAGGVVERARDFLTSFQKELLQGERLYAPLLEQHLHVERGITLGSGSKKRTAVRGFRVVDAERLGALGDEAAGAWLRNGLLAHVFAHLHSLALLDRLSVAPGAVDSAA